MLLKSLASPWAAALLLQATLSGVLIAKRMWRRFPIFLAYCVSSLILNGALFLIYVSHWRRPLYFKAYWLTEAIGWLMGLAVVYEIFKHLFRPYPALRKLATHIFQSAVILLVLLGCIVAYAQHLGESNHVQAGLMVVDQASRILEVGLLAFLFLFASAFGLHWRQYVFGIASGLGLFAAVELVGITMRLQFGITASPIFNVVRTISYNSSLIIWMSYILSPELATSPSELPKRAQLEQWNQAIMELIYQ